MTAVAMSAKFSQVQSAIDDLNLKYHKEVDDYATARDVKKNPIFAARAAFLRQRKISGRFWASVLRAHPDLHESLMGPYDDEILNHLEDFNVEYLPQGGFRIELTFGKNDFFDDAKLWATVEKQEESERDIITTSDVHWKAGKGPEESDCDDEEVERKPGTKTTRDDAGAARGPSMLECFHAMPDDPELVDDEEEEEEEDEEELEEKLNWFADMHAARMDVFHCLVEEVWEDPKSVLMPSSSCGDEGSA